MNANVIQIGDLWYAKRNTYFWKCMYLLSDEMADPYVCDGPYYPASYLNGELQESLVCVIDFGNFHGKRPETFCLVLFGEKRRCILQKDLIRRVGNNDTNL